MGQLLILLAVALVAAALAWGVAVLLLGRDQGLDPVEPDSRAIPLPTARPLTEADLGQLRFDTAVRGYQMGQVDQALRRIGYDIGYKEELIGVLEAEVGALRAGRAEEAEALRHAREAAQRPRTGVPADEPEPADRARSGAAAEPGVAAGPGGAAGSDDAVDDWVASGARGTRSAGAQPADAEK
jgi:DivIVA domain-containing protein